MMQLVKVLFSVADTQQQGLSLKPKSFRVFVNLLVMVAESSATSTLKRKRSHGRSAISKKCSMRQSLC